MAAPNGARRTRQDHPALPVQMDQIIRAAIDCQKAGAGGLHAHVRDADGAHVLDAGLYMELVTELERQAPDLLVQITTEAVGRYSPLQQRELVQAVRPEFVSIALREMDDGEPESTLRKFYHWAHDEQIAVQHILYTPDEVRSLAAFIQDGVIPGENLEVLFVLGRYTAGQQSSPSDMLPFVENKTQLIDTAQWALCAFGQQETACLVETVRLGGKARIGFENNLLNIDGSVAVDNAARVSELVNSLRQAKLMGTSA